MYYSIVDKANGNNLATVSRLQYELDGMNNKIVYAGSKEECIAFNETFGVDEPYPIYELEIA